MRKNIALLLLTASLMSIPAYAAPQDSIDEVILMYGHALRAKHDAVLRAVLWVENAEEEERLQALLEPHAPFDLRWQLDAGVIRAWAPKEGVVGLYTYLIKTDRGYVPKDFVIRQNENGDPLIEFASTDLFDAADDAEVASPAVSAIRKLDSEINRWKNANGDELKALIASFRIKIRSQIAVIETANKHKLELATGYGTIEQRQSLLDAVVDGTDEELRRFVVEQLRQEIASLKGED